MFSGFQNWLAGLDANTALAVRCAMHTLVGGALGLYVRELYRRFSSSLTKREGFADLFPLLTAITVVIIFVVKSSLALSLGLVGALSIVRFRTAIKNPEELVYLFLCIGIGVGLGAELTLLTASSVAVVTLFVVANSLRKGRSARHNLLLTVSGEAKRFFDASQEDVVSMLEKRTRRLRVQRFDLEDGQVQFRATVSLTDAQDANDLVSYLKEKLPQFQVSYVDLETLQ